MNMSTNIFLGIPYIRFQMRTYNFTIFRGPTDANTIYSEKQYSHGELEGKMAQSLRKLATICLWVLEIESMT